MNHDQDLADRNGRAQVQDLWALGEAGRVVEPLDRLPVGQPARVVYISTRDPARLVRLSNLGLVPGARLQLQQRTPAAVLRIGETTLAVEPEVAGEIYVTRAW